MALYSVYFFCNECGDVHPLGISVNLDDGPTKKESVNDVYQGKELPGSIVTLNNISTICPKTKIKTSQKNNDQVFLVPIA